MCNQYEKLPVTYFAIFHLFLSSKAFRASTYFTLMGSSFSLATFQVLSSHTWLVMVLDTVDT